MAVLVFALLAGVQAVPGRFAITTDSLPPAMRGEPYYVQLTTTGGVSPMRWEVVGGRIPPGIALDPDHGILRGAPESEGDYVFAVRVTDASTPRQTATRNFQARVTRPLTIDWVQPPRIDGAAIRGSVRAWNGTGLDVDLTVVIVAVNEVGKAFTLGYQKLPLLSNRMTPEIGFGTTLPRGSYSVHADAVGESAPRNAIIRSRRQHPALRIE